MFVPQFIRLLRHIAWESVHLYRNVVRDGFLTGRVYIKLALSKDSTVTSDAKVHIKLECPTHVAGFIPHFLAL